MITVYTALFSEDGIKDYGGLYEYPFKKEDFDYDIEFIAFTNILSLKSDIWDIRQVEYVDDPRLLSRRYKTMGFEEFSTSEYTMWLDNTCICAVDFKAVLESYLKNWDWAVHLHIDRENTAQEAAICKSMQLDLPEVIEHQLAYYKDKGFDINSGGLYETGVTMRRNNNAVKKANRNWWSSIAMFSVRDQISLPYVFSQNPEVRVNAIPYTFCAHQSALGRLQTPHFYTIPREKIN